MAAIQNRAGRLIFTLKFRAPLGDYGLHPKPEQPMAASPMSGVMWMLVGIGLLVWLSLSPKSLFHPSFAAIPIAIGVAYLISFLYERRAKKL